MQPSKINWSALVVLAGKKDGTSRFCVVFFELNAITRKYAFPLPLIDQILDCLVGTQFYSSFDLAARYWPKTVY